MRFSSSKPRARSTLVSLVGIVCVALLLMVGIAQVAHSHRSGHPDPDCALCVTAHQAIQVVALITLKVSSRPVEHVLLDTAEQLPRFTLFFRLDCRPPPTESASV